MSHNAIFRELGGGEMTWQPIETAPKDGSRVLVYDHGWCGGGPRIAVSQWIPYRHRDGRGEWRTTGGFAGVTDATHWMPLPEPPSLTATPPSPDVERLRLQAREISRLLAGAGVGSCSLTEGVRVLIRRGEEMRADPGVP